MGIDEGSYIHGLEASILKRTTICWIESILMIFGQLGGIMGQNLSGVASNETSALFFHRLSQRVILHPVDLSLSLSLSLFLSLSLSLIQLTELVFEKII